MTKFEQHSQDPKQFKYLEEDYSNVPKNIEDFKGKLSDLYLRDPDTRKGIGIMFEKFSNHPNPKVSKAANDFLDHYRKELLIQLSVLDKKEQKITSKEVMQAANDPDYRRQYRSVG